MSNCTPQYILLGYLQVICKLFGNYFRAHTRDIRAHKIYGIYILQTFMGQNWDRLGQNWDRFPCMSQLFCYAKILTNDTFSAIRTIFCIYTLL